MSLSSERKAGLILGFIAMSEGSVVLWLLLGNGWRFVAYLGFARGRAGTALGWLGAVLVAIAFVRISLRMPSVRANLWRPSALKLLAVAVAIAAGVLEEAVFRKTIMDAAMQHGLSAPTQVALSALAFGLAHGVWGLFSRSLRAAIGATIATAVLGAALAVVYLAGEPRAMHRGAFRHQSCHRAGTRPRRHARGDERTAIVEQWIRTVEMRELPLRASAGR